jgi:OFA family oxalate/formate antiporter-like MFS transporter
MKKYLVALSGMFMFLFLGLIYAWSIFVAPLEGEFGWSRSQTSLVFTICMSAFCLGGITSAQLKKNFKPEWIVFASGLLAGTGFYMASYTQSLWQLYVFYGGFCGFAVGSAYNCMLSVIPLHFPKRIGLLNGLMLMFFGMGSLVFGPIITGLISAYSWRFLFKTLALAFALCFAALSVVVKMPVVSNKSPEAVVVEQGSIEVKEMLRMNSFWLFFIWEVVIAAVGLGAIGHAASIAKDIHLSGSLIPYAVGILAASSGVGKLCSGILSDKTGVIKTAYLMTFVGILGNGLLIIGLTTLSPQLLFMSFSLIGFAYGGGPSLNAAFVRKSYGTKNFSWSFSLMSCSLMCAAVMGTYVAGMLRSSSGNYFSTIAVMICYLIIGLASLKCLQQNQVERV